MDLSDTQDEFYQAKLSGGLVVRTNARDWERLIRFVVEELDADLLYRCIRAGRLRIVEERR